jgi:hydrogenase maturation protease
VTGPGPRGEHGAPAPLRGTIVVGVGTAMRGDDAVGLIVAREVAAAIGERDDVTVVEASGEPGRLLAVLAGHDRAILVDAMVSGAAIGTVRWLDPAAASATMAGPTSSHGLGLAQSLALGLALGRLPPETMVCAIEGASFDHGADLSPAVATAARLAVEAIVYQLARSNTLPLVDS